MRSKHELLRFACRLRTLYEKRAAEDSKKSQLDWGLLDRRVDQVQRQRHFADQARSHGWYVAEQRHGELLSAAFLGLQSAVREMHECSIEPPTDVPTLRELFEEVRHVFNEFETVTLDWTKKVLDVQTEPIVLEGTHLGPFVIRLLWPRLARWADVECFEIIALDPSPAAANENITHPHVRDNHLCAGDATMPLQNALAQGRLVDAFCLIRSVLTTYNAHSPFQSLDDWNGVSCWNCSSQTSDDDRYYCESCEHDVCSDCTSFCKGCDRTYCTSCQTRCDVCDEPCCNRCLTTSACSELSCCDECLKECAICSNKVASSEIDEATQVCTDCQAAADEIEAVVLAEPTVQTNP